MTIREFNDKFRDYSLRHKFVNAYSEGDVYEIMNEGEKRYPQVVLTINSARTNDSMLILNCNVFYIDRLTESGDNRLQIWNVGIDALDKIMRMLCFENFMIQKSDNIVYQPFTEKFQDLCAGVYATVEFDILNNVNSCYNELYEEEQKEPEVDCLDYTGDESQMGISLAGWMIRTDFIEDEDNTVQKCFDEIAGVSEYTNINIQVNRGKYLDGGFRVQNIRDLETVRHKGYDYYIHMFGDTFNDVYLTSYVQSEYSENELKEKLKLIKKD